MYEHLFECIENRKPRQCHPFAFPNICREIFSLSDPSSIIHSLFPPSIFWTLNNFAPGVLESICMEFFVLTLRQLKIMSQSHLLSCDLEHPWRLPWILRLGTSGVRYPLNETPVHLRFSNHLPNSILTRVKMDLEHIAGILILTSTIHSWNQGQF